MHDDTSGSPSSSESVNTKAVASFSTSTLLPLVVLYSVASDVASCHVPIAWLLGVIPSSLQLTCPVAFCPTTCFLQPAYLAPCLSTWLRFAGPSYRHGYHIAFWDDIIIIWDDIISKAYSWSIEIAWDDIIVVCGDDIMSRAYDLSVWELDHDWIIISLWCEEN